MPNNSSSTVLKPFAAYALLAIAQRGVWLLMLPIYVLYLSPEDVGVLIVITFTAGILTVAATLKLDAAMRTFYFDFAADSAELREYLVQVLIASAAFSAVTFLILLTFGDFVFSALFQHSELAFSPLGLVATATACLSACILPYAIYLRNGHQLRKLTWLQLSLAISSLLIQLYLIIVMDLGILGALLGPLIPALLAVIYLLATNVNLRVDRFKLNSLRTSLAYSLPLIIFSFCYVLESRLDLLVLEHFLDLHTLGGYAILISVMGFLSFTLNAMDSAIRPSLFGLLKSTSSESRADISRLRGLYFGAGLGVLVIASVLGYWLGWIADDAVYTEIRRWIPFAAVAFAPEIVVRFYALFYDFHKRSAEVTLWIVIRLLLMFAVLLAAVPTFGIGGALFAIFLSQTANASYFSITSKKKFLT